MINYRYIYIYIWYTYIIYIYVYRIIYRWTELTMVTNRLLSGKILQGQKKYPPVSTKLCGFHRENLQIPLRFNQEKGDSTTKMWKWVLVNKYRFELQEWDANNMRSALNSWTNCRCWGKNKNNLESSHQTSAPKQSMQLASINIRQFPQKRRIQRTKQMHITKRMRMVNRPQV